MRESAVSAVARTMRWLRTHLQTIRVRLTLWYVALLALILITFSAFLYLRLAQSLRDATDLALVEEARRVIATLDVQDGMPALGDGSDQLPAGMVVVLYRANGQFQAASDTHRSPPGLPALPADLQGATRGSSTLVTAQLSNGEDWRVLTQPVVDQGRLVAILQVLQSEQPAEVALRNLALLIGLAIPLTLLLAVAGGIFLASRALGPIDRITLMAKRMGAEDLSRRLDLPPSQDEVGRLAATFDQMLGRLDDAFQRQRQFTADASHELRTPLAVLTSQAEVALECSREPAEYKQALTAIRDEAQRMAHLLAEMLTLARADGGAEAIGQEPVTLHDLVDDVVATLVPFAETREVLLEAGEIVATVVQGDQTRLVQLLVNLVENGIKYTPEGGQVRLSLRQVDGWACLAVTDTGIGMAPEHLPHLCERFYRVDEAQTRDQGGVGLGLAIADWIVRVHRGRLEVVSTPGTGSTFTVWLPLVDAGASGR